MSNDFGILQLKVPGQKKKSVSPECERIILDKYQTYQSGPVILEKTIKKIHGVAISHNTIYQVMVMHQLVVENPRKKS
jgi:IS30 family transposase